MSEYEETIDKRRDTGGNLDLFSPEDAIRLKSRKQSGVGPPVAVLDPEVDLIWAKRGGKGPIPSSYFDYYYTGDDIKVYVEGASDSPDGVGVSGGCMPLVSLAFNIEQKKQPVYGFASYTYDGVMRGTRIVTGQIVIATISTDYMTNLLSEAADSRMEAAANRYAIRTTTEDEKNINKYWTKNIDPSRGYSKKIFSSHPPFNLIVAYGMQSVSASEPFGSSGALLEQYQDNPAMFGDQNQRLVDSDLDQKNKRLINNVELVSMSTEYDSSGNPCMEVYSFFARDHVII